MDDELAVSEKGFHQSDDAKIGSFLINVLDPLFAASVDDFDPNHPLTPLSTQEQDAINNLRVFNKKTERPVNVVFIL